MRSRRFAFWGALLTLMLGACATVKPWERQHLAERSMSEPYAQDMGALEYRDKVIRTKTGSSLPAAAPGGGCGCTQ